MGEIVNKKIIIDYNPDGHPNIEISTPKMEPKNDLLILCDAVTSVIKIMHEQNIQEDHVSMKAAQDRMNVNFMNMKNIIAETIKTESQEDWQGRLLREVNDSISRCKEAPFGELLGIMFNITLDNHLRHYKNMGEI